MNENEYIKMHSKPTSEIKQEGFLYMSEVKELMKGYASHKLSMVAAICNGALDGLELDNTCDVVEKSLVIDTIKDILKETKINP